MLEIKARIKESKISPFILIKAGLRREIGQLLTEWYHGDKILIVTDENVSSYYGQEISRYLSQSGYQVFLYTLPAGEGAKTYQYLYQGYDFLIEHGFKRDNLILALGGGVVGDLAGFLAATYLRGVSYVQLPSTLLAQVDSSIGGKTAINHAAGKNLIGTFYQPKMVLIDPEFLLTLETRQLLNGLAEVIKVALIADPELVKYLLDLRARILACELTAIIPIIEKSCLIKSRIVEEDYQEQGKRMLLNFGHTIGHALEALNHYRGYTHGEAVALGMVGAARLSYLLALLSREKLSLVEELLSSFNFQLSCQYQEKAAQLYQKLAFDKKANQKGLRWVLLKDIGKALIKEKVDPQLVQEVLEGLCC